MAVSFLTLPGELREQIYVEALTFDKETLRCTAQLLRTCKQIYRETPKYLHDNVVDVKVRPNGVHAYNIRCGIYSPQTCLRGFCTRNICWSREKSSHKRDVQSADFRMIAWPSFLRKVVSMRFTLDGEWDVHDLEYRLTSVENVWFSLCSFLHGEHKLQFVDVDMHRHDTTIDSHEGQPRTSAIDLWPARALGDLKRFSVCGIERERGTVSPTFRPLSSIPDIDTIKSSELAIVRSINDLYIEKLVLSSDMDIETARREVAGCIRTNKAWRFSLQTRCWLFLCADLLFIKQLEAFEAERRPSSDARTELGQYCTNIRRALEIYPLLAGSVLMLCISQLLRAELERHCIDEVCEKIWGRKTKVGFGQYKSKSRKWRNA